MSELNQLRCFVAVAEELHFGRAAARLNMTRPSLSRQIQLLEQMLEAQLLERSSRVVRLTPTGRALLPEARRIVRLSDSAASRTRWIWRGEAGTLCVGFTAASGYSRVPALLELVRRRLPDVDVVLREMAADSQIEELDNGTIDVGLLHARPPSSRLVTLPMCSVGFAVVLALDDPLLEQTSLSPNDLDGRDFIGYAPSESKYLFDLSMNLFDRAGVRPHVVQQAGQIHTMVALVAAGFGAALVPASAMCLRMPGVEFRPFVTHPCEPVELMMVWLRANENPAMKALVEAYVEDRRLDRA